MQKKSLNEFYGDNGDRENERDIEIEKYLIGNEEKFGTFDTLGIITNAINLGRQSDSLQTIEIARVVDRILKSR